MTQHDLIVIGSGPGGYTAAIRGSQLGMDTACIDKEPDLGGTCLRIGCIPSKALLESSRLYWEAGRELAHHGIHVGEMELDLAELLSRKQRTVESLTQGVASLFKKHQITRYHGHARLGESGRVIVDTENGSQELKARHILIATGSKPATLPGIEFDGDRIGTSTHALAYKEVPEHLVVIGAGYIGMELGIVWHRLGAQVTVLEYADAILTNTDAEIGKAALKLFRKQGLEIRLETRVTSAQVANGRCIVESENGEPIECDRVLVAVGRSPNTDGLALESRGIDTDDNGFIPVERNYKTSADDVYAIGDVIGGPMLAHKAEDEGIACVEALATGRGHVDYDAIPSVVYTEPEVASVGKTEQELDEADISFRKGLFPFRANARARTLGHTDGLIKVLADSKTDRLLGVHIVGPRAGDLIAEAATAIAFQASAEDVARCSHAHPTLSEALREAALAVDDRALNI